MREVASNLSRPQQQDVISDPFPSSIDIFETNVDIISFEDGRIVIVRDLLWLWGMIFLFFSQQFREKGHLYLGTGYEKKAPKYPCSRKQCHICFELFATCMNWILLIPLKNHTAWNGHHNLFLFCWTVPLSKGPPTTLRVFLTLRRSCVKNSTKILFRL